MLSFLIFFLSIFSLLFSSTLVGYSSLIFTLFFLIQLCFFSFVLYRTEEMCVCIEMILDFILLYLRFCYYAVRCKCVCMFFYLSISNNNSLYCHNKILNCHDIGSVVHFSRRILFATDKCFCSQTNSFANCSLCLSFLSLFLHSTNHFLYYCLITNWNVPNKFRFRNKNKTERPGFM